MAKLTAKQQRFVDEYLIDLNATQAAIRAGYSPSTAKDIGCQNLAKLNIKNRIEERMAEKEKELIADQNEVLKYLTSVMRGRSRASIVIVENIGDYMSQAREMEKSPDEKERLKAAELLGKRYGLFDKRDQAVKTGEKNNLLEAISAAEEINTDDLPEVE
nr:MAG TPA: Terminase small subunit [Caudoviricetes sp.]